MVGAGLQGLQGLRLHQQLARVLLGLAAQRGPGLVAVEAGRQRAQVQGRAVVGVGKAEAAGLLLFVGQREVNFLVVEALKHRVVGFGTQRHVVLRAETLLRGVCVEALFIGVLGEQLQRADDEPVVGFGAVVVGHGFVQAPLPAAIGEQSGLAALGRTAKNEQRLLRGHPAHLLPQRRFGPRPQAQIAEGHRCGRVLPVAARRLLVGGEPGKAGVGHRRHVVGLGAAGLNGEARTQLIEGWQIGLRPDNVESGDALGFHLRQNFIAQAALGRQLVQNGHVEISTCFQRRHAGQGQRQVKVVVGQHGGAQGFQIGVGRRARQQHPQLAFHNFNKGCAGVVERREFAGLGHHAHFVAALAGSRRRDLERDGGAAATGGQGQAAAVQHAGALAQFHCGGAARVALEPQLGFQRKLVAAEGHAVVGETGQAQVAFGHGVAHGHAVNGKVIVRIHRAAALVHQAVAEEHHAGQIAAIVGVARFGEHLVEVGGGGAETKRIEPSRPVGA